MMTDLDVFILLGSCLMLGMAYRINRKPKRGELPRTIRFENVRIQYVEASQGNLEGQGRRGDQAFISRRISFNVGPEIIEIWEPFLNTKGQPDLRLAWVSDSGSN